MERKRKKRRQIGNIEKKTDKNHIKKQQKEI